MRASTSSHFLPWLPPLPPLITNTTLLETIKNPTSTLKQILTTYSLASKNPHFRHDFPTYSALLTYLSTSPSHIPATDLVLRRMRRHGLVPGPSLLLPLISAHSAAGRHAAAADLFLRFPHSDRVFSFLFRSLLADGEVGIARDLFSAAADLGFPIKVRYYNELIKGSCDFSSVDDGIYIFKGMMDRGVTPDVITFSILMGSLGKEGRVLEVNSFFCKLLRMGVSVDIGWYMVLFELYRRNKMVRDAIEVARAMDDRFVGEEEIGRRKILDFVEDTGETVLGYLLKSGFIAKFEEYESENPCGLWHACLWRDQESAISHLRHLSTKM